MSIKLIASVAATTVALASACAFAQNDDLSSRVSALESQINSMTGGAVTINSALSYDLLNGASAVDQSANVKNAKLSANSLILGGYVQAGYQRSNYKASDVAKVTTGQTFGFDVASMGMVARVGNDVSIVVTSSAIPEDNKSWSKATDDSSGQKVVRNISGPFDVKQAYGVWNVNDQFYVFGGKKDLAFGDYSSVNYMSGDIDSVRGTVDGVGIGSDTMIDGLTVVGTLYNSNDSVYNKAPDKAGVSNWALNTSYSGLADGLRVGAGIMNAASQKNGAGAAGVDPTTAAAGGKVGAMTVNFGYDLPGTDFSFSGNYFQLGKKLGGAKNKRSQWDLGGTYSNIADSGINAALSYSTTDNGQAKNSKASQWVLSSNYDLNAHANIGVELARLSVDKKITAFKRTGNTIVKDQQFNAFTVDFTAWF